MSSPHRRVEGWCVLAGEGPLARMARELPRQQGLTVKEPPPCAEHGLLIVSEDSIRSPGRTVYRHRLAGFMGPIVVLSPLSLATWLRLDPDSVFLTSEGVHLVSLPCDLVDLRDGLGTAPAAEDLAIFRHQLNARRRLAEVMARYKHSIQNRTGATLLLQGARASAVFEGAEDEQKLHQELCDRVMAVANHVCGDSCSIDAPLCESCLFAKEQEKKRPLTLDPANLRSDLSVWDLAGQFTRQGSHVDGVGKGLGIALRCLAAAAELLTIPEKSPLEGAICRGAARRGATIVERLGAESPSGPYSSRAAQIFETSCFSKARARWGPNPESVVIRKVAWWTRYAPSPEERETAGTHTLQGTILRYSGPSKECSVPTLVLSVEGAGKGGELRMKVNQCRALRVLSQKEIGPFCSEYGFAALGRRCPVRLRWEGDTPRLSCAVEREEDCPGRSALLESGKSPPTFRQGPAAPSRRQ